MIRKNTFTKSGGYDLKFKYGQDYELWVRMLSLGEAHILNNELCVIRMGKHSLSSKNKRKLKLEGLKIRWRAFRKFGGDPSEAFYYFMKSMIGLIFPSATYFDR
jgi:GT2 family glycosyltransferase